MRKSKLVSQRFRENIGLYSTVLAIFSYVFGPWQGNASGAWLVWDLVKFLQSDNQLIDTTRQETILTMLGGIIMGLVMLLILQIVGLRIRHRVFPALQVLFATITIAGLAALYFRFNAITLGIFVTTFSTMVALLSSLSALFSHMPGSIPNRATAKKRIERQWAQRFAEAKMSEAKLSMLSFKTVAGLPNYFWEDMREELRMKDSIMQVKDGQYLMLWNVSSRASTAIARKIQGVIQEKTGSASYVGISSFPLDAATLGSLVERADAAVTTAETSDSGSIVISIDENRVTQHIHNEWRPVITEAWADDTPVSILVFATEGNVTLKEASILEGELRLRDRVFMSNERLFVLLWDTAQSFNVARKLQSKLERKTSRQFAVGMAQCIKVGKQCDEVLALAVDHLKDAQQQTGLRIVPPFSRKKSAPYLREDWAATLLRAKQESVPVSILALETSKATESTPFDLLSKELRNADQLFPLSNGAYILLWNTDPKSAIYVARKLKQLMQDNNHKFPRLGIATSDVHGYDLALLIAHADKSTDTKTLNGRLKQPA